MRVRTSLGFCVLAFAMEEIARCATNPHVKGIKLHFGNSDVDVRKAIAANVAPYLR